MKSDKVSRVEKPTQPTRDENLDRISAEKPKSMPRSGLRDKSALVVRARRRKTLAERKAAVDPELRNVITDLKVYLRKHPMDMQAILAKIVTMARAGDLRAIDMILNRVEGLPVQQHVISGELPVQLIFVPYNQASGSSTDAPAKEIGPEVSPTLIEGQFSEAMSTPGVQSSLDPPDGRACTPVDNPKLSCVDN